MNCTRRMATRPARLRKRSGCETGFRIRNGIRLSYFHWPGFAEDWREDGHAAYALELDRRMRAIAPSAPRHPVVVPLTVARVRALAVEAEIDEDAAEARARAAYEVAQEGGAVTWPPGRNEPCWCGSTKKYKKCCGR